MNLEMHQLMEILDAPRDLSPDDLVRSFFEKYPDYPVVKVKLRPGEAYPHRADAKSHSRWDWFANSAGF